jgi:hypothetical protein
MTQDEIIDMAIQAGASPDENKIWLMYAEEIETFAKLVAAKATAVEREACANVCEETTASWTQVVYNGACMDCAIAIRARGEQA